MARPWLPDKRQRSSSFGTTELSLGTIGSGLLLVESHSRVLLQASTPGLTITLKFQCDPAKATRTLIAQLGCQPGRYFKDCRDAEFQACVDLAHAYAIQQ